MMAFNSLLGKRGIIKAMLGHTAADYVLERPFKNLANRFGYIGISIFGYPLNPVERLRSHTILKYLPAKGKILDVGCTFGVYCFELAKRGYDVSGIDTNIESIELANEIKRWLGLQNVRFIHQNILANQFAASEFDAIIMVEVLEHIRDDDEAIEELCRILKDDGVLVISVPYVQEIEEYMEPLPACRTSEGKNVCVGEGGSHWRNGYNLSSLTSLLDSKGLSIVHYNYTCVPNILRKSMIWFPLVYPLSLLSSRFSGNRIELTAFARKV